MHIGSLPVWNYSNAELIETRKVFGIRRHLYKLPDLVRIHNLDSPVYFYHYEPEIVRKDPSVKRGLVISYPLLGGKMITDSDGKHVFKDAISQLVAYYCTLTMKSHSIVVATNNKAILDPRYSPSDVKLELDNVLINHRQVHDFIINSGYFETVNLKKVHHVGMSLGALTAILVVAATQWYSSLTAIVGGAPMSQIMGYSKEDIVKNYFEGAMWNMDLTKEELLKQIEVSLKNMDTEEAIKLIDKDKIRLVLALLDDSVPNHIFKKDVPNTGFQLKKFAGNPKTSVFPTSHRGTILAIPYLFWTIGKHIKKHGGI